jgi:hypothetical protein
VIESVAIVGNTTTASSAPLSFTADRDLVLLGVAASTQVVVSNRQDLTWNDWNGLGTLPDGLAESLLAITGNFNSLQLNIPVPGGTPIYVAFSNTGVCQLLLDDPIVS